MPRRDYPLWSKMKRTRALTVIELELTARCNLNCAHCYINLPSGDREAKEREMSVSDIDRIVEEAVSLGAIGCLLTGGEPLLRDDFEAIYLLMKQKGLLVTVFTNATLITDRHVRLFQKYPPNDIEVTVYGATEATYERVCRRKGGFAAFQRGLERLRNAGIAVRLKTVALSSNQSEIASISRFCRERTKDSYRFDPLIHLRYDRNPERNREIRKERLSAEAIVDIEKDDTRRFRVLTEGCDRLIGTSTTSDGESRLFLCGAGADSACVSPEGLLRPCSTLWHPDCIYDLKSGSLYDAWWRFMPSVRAMRSTSSEFLEQCGACPLVNLCHWCPATAYLEMGKLDAPVDYFCKVAHLRAAQIQFHKAASIAN